MHRSLSPSAAPAPQLGMGDASVGAPELASLTQQTLEAHNASLNPELDFYAMRDRVRKMVYERMDAEGREEPTHEELELMNPTPPNVKYTSSASSMSSEMSDNEVETVGNTSLWAPKRPDRWAENRLVQIQECLHTFYENEFLKWHDMQRAVRWAEKMLSYVLLHMKECETRAMANSAYWSIHLCQIAFSRREFGCGYMIEWKMYEKMQHAVECWNMANMHKVLMGDKSKSFRDPATQGSLTSIDSRAARKNRIPAYLLRGSERRKRMDVRALGDEAQQIKKSASFFEIWRLAGLDEENPVDTRIVDRRPPDTRQLQFSGSTLERVGLRVLSDKDSLLAMKATGREALAGRQRGMLGASVKSSSVVPRNLFNKSKWAVGPALGKKSKLSTGSIEKYSVSSFIHSESDSEPEFQDGVPVARQKKGISRNGAADDDEASGPVDRATVPSDDEADADEGKETFLKEFIATEVCDPETRRASSTPSETDDAEPAEAAEPAESEKSSDEDEDYEDSDVDDAVSSDSDEDLEDTGPREEGAITITDAEIHEKTKAFRGLSLSDSDRAKFRMVDDAKNKQKRNERLTALELKALNWFKNLDPEALKEGELRRKKRPPTWQQILKRKQKEAQKRKSEARRIALKTTREELHAAILEERNERKRAILERQLEEAAEKLKRAEDRGRRRIERFNFKINDFRRRQKERNRKKQERLQADADRKLKNARKRNMNAVIHSGDFKMTIVLRKEPEEAPLAEEELVAASYADVYKVEQRVAKRLKNGAAVPMPIASGAEGAIRIRVAPRPGARSGTRAAAAIAAKQKALDEADAQLKAAAAAAAASSAAVAEAQTKSADAMEVCNQLEM